MGKISLIKKIKLFFLYKKTLSNNSRKLQELFSIKIDRASRFYTVRNIPKELIGEEYSLNTNDINRISKKYIDDYLKDLSIFLNENGLKELYKSYDVRKIDKYSYVLIFGYSLFNSVRYYNILYYILIPIITILSSFFIFFY